MSIVDARGPVSTCQRAKAEWEDTHGLFQQGCEVLLVQDSGPNVHRGLPWLSSAPTGLLPLSFVRYRRLACAAFGRASSGRNALIVVLVPAACASSTTGRLGVVGALQRC